jgi:hypothetical protein
MAHPQDENPHFIECAKIAAFSSSEFTHHMTPIQQVALKKMDALVFAARHYYDREKGDTILNAQCLTHWELLHDKTRPKLAHAIVQIVEDLLGSETAYSINRLSNLVFREVMRRITPAKPRDPCLGGVRLPPPIPDAPIKRPGRPPAYKSNACLGIGLDGG